MNVTESPGENLDDQGVEQDTNAVGSPDENPDGNSVECHRNGTESPVIHRTSILIVKVFSIITQRCECDWFIR